MKSWVADYGEQRTRVLWLNSPRELVAALRPQPPTHWLIDARVADFHPTTIRQLTGIPRINDPRIRLIRVSEKIKSSRQVESLYDWCAKSGIRRSDHFGIIGGGALSDLGGYVAATWLRGISWTAVPTTLLAMIDAAIGGKTGINRPSGKNQVGAIWHPARVMICPHFLGSLPTKEVRSGMGEVLKYAGLIGGQLLKRCMQLPGHLPSELTVSSDFHRMMRTCIEHKVHIVAGDPRESGTRMTLNLGHTFAHAIEKELGYGRITHGEAVTLGLLAANRLSVLTGTALPESLREYDTLLCRHARHIRRRSLSVAALVSQMKGDKKSDASGLRFVLLERPGKPVVRERIPETIVVRSLNEMLTDLSE